MRPLKEEKRHSVGEGRSVGGGSTAASSLGSMIGRADTSADEHGGKEFY